MGIAYFSWVPPLDDVQMDHVAIGQHLTQFLNPSIHCMIVAYFAKVIVHDCWKTMGFQLMR